MARFLGQQASANAREREKLSGSLGHVETYLRRNSLPTAAEAVLEFRMEVDARIRGELNHPLFASEIVARVEEIHRTIRREMRSTTFLYVSAERRQYYTEPTKDWEAVIRKWPKASLDITESSRCFALERFAASIFHILLVAEFGVIQICDLLGVSGDKPGWGCVQRLERTLAKPYKDRTDLEQQHSALLTDLVPMIVAVKDSSRHKIMHVDNRLVWLDVDLGPQVASEVIASTRGFMRRLAKELP
jgi:hypothetical protein